MTRDDDAVCRRAAAALITSLLEHLTPTVERSSLLFCAHVVVHRAGKMYFFMYIKTKLLLIFFLFCSAQISDCWSRIEMARQRTFRFDERQHQRRHDDQDRQQRQRRRRRCQDRCVGCVVVGSASEIAGRGAAGVATVRCWCYSGMCSDVLCVKREKERPERERERMLLFF